MDIFIFIIIIGIVIAVSIASQQNREKQKDAWRRLAAAHHLTFVSNDSYFGNGAYVTGNYRGHSVRLETVEIKQGKSSVTYTRVSIFAARWPKNSHPKDQAGPPLSFQDALNRVISSPHLQLSEKIKAEPGGQLIYYEQRDVIQDTKFLEYLFESLTSLAEAYPVVMAYGGEAVSALSSALNNKPTEEIATQLLRDIAQNTTARLANHTSVLLCPKCLTRFGPHKIDLPWAIDPTYYGCRTCGQSREFLKGSVIALLDSRVSATPTQQDGVVRVNWSARHELFDFDAVEIAQATDEEVERFAVQVGNDTDSARKPRYEEMQCSINSNCELSENTLRILRRTFGQVVVANDERHRTEKESGMNSGLLGK